ncbi:thiamine pyrophosphate-dependent enzyme [Helicobacter sp. 11S02596-1]|uniref:thiamine pyrophosphate-dependent enzyme n=1 Tax=Helicobacter sp. 11S02596-1 TaxID=1476194 RepID=UPI000BA51563|nr:thiamine pyrophosphate-dependent enzyme [Helicobacter sp. 11S02596-1]PAF41423.1 hypothetical protein BJI48_08675 [Helicobacter sp. 11S02596-1]
MLEMQALGNALKNLGFKTASGVPCSLLSPLINYSLEHMEYLMANDEGSALGIISGMALGGKRGFVLMQNSGLSNALSMLSSFNAIFQVGVLGFVSLRGERIDGINHDEPQHELMGKITQDVLNLFEVKNDFLSPDISVAKHQLERACEFLEHNQSYFFIVRPKTIAPFSHTPIAITPKPTTHIELFDSESVKNDTNSHQSPLDSCLPHRIDALKIISELLKQEPIIGLFSTGKCGREAYTIADLPNNLYMVGSMGYVSAIGLGISKASTHKVICVDGDGSYLMQMGLEVANAFYAGANFCQIVLDNATHDSTGGQFTLSPQCDFLSLAKGFGYANIYICGDLDDFAQALQSFAYGNFAGPSFIYLRIKSGSIDNLMRPKISPKAVARRLSDFIAKGF